MDQKRNEVLEHLYMDSDLPEEQERVRQIYFGCVRTTDYDKAKEEWAAIEKLHLIPTMKILWELGHKCADTGVPLWLDQDCRDSVLIRAAGITYYRQENPKQKNFRDFFCLLYAAGPLLMCNAEVLSDVQDIITGCFLPCRVFKEGYTKYDKNGCARKAVHPAHLLVIPMNHSIENVSNTSVNADYCLDIIRQIYPTPQDDGIPFCTSDYKEICDKVWRCRLFVNLIPDLTWNDDI